MNTAMKKQTSSAKKKTMHQKVAQEKVSIEHKIREDVLKKLGKPSSLEQIKITNVYGDKWRVNVYIDFKKGEGTTKGNIISDSFFCTVKKDGKFTYKPKIVKKY